MRKKEDKETKESPIYLPACCLFVYLSIIHLSIFLSSTYHLSI